MSRQDRVSEALRKEISLILHDEIKDPRLGFITLTKVEISADLRDAKVFYSVLGQDEDYKKTKAALDSASGFIRKLVGERIDLRFVPEIIFRQDRSGEYSIRIEEVLNEIKKLTPTPPDRVAKAKQEARKEEPGELKKSRRRAKKE